MTALRKKLESGGENLESGLYNGLLKLNGLTFALYKDKKTASVQPNQTKQSGHITIPPTIEYDGVTYQVDAIGISAFDGCDGLTSIEFPNTMEYIDRFAFRGCTGLTSITLPNNVEGIGQEAFLGCHNNSKQRNSNRRRSLLKMHKPELCDLWKRS